MGRRQVVRHRILVPAFGGSNPPAPAFFIQSQIKKIKIASFVFNMPANYY